MRKKKSYQPHFTFSYDELVAMSIDKESFLRRDLVDLAAKGITEAQINAMVALRVALQNIPEEETENATTTEAVKTRDETVALLTGALRTVINIAIDTYGDKSSEYQLFKIKRLSRLKPNELYTQAPKIVVSGNKYLDVMDDYGLTADMLTNITSLTNNLMDFVSNTSTVEGDSRGVTGDRRTAADNLYDSMSPMCKTANRYFKPINETKAANYILYNSDGKPVVRKGIVKAGKSSSPKTKDIKGTTKFKLKTNIGTSLQYFFALTKGSVTTASAITVDLNKKAFINTTAAKLGYNKAAGMIVLNILNDNEEEAGFVVRMGG